jgi:hypothetical protein
MFPRLLSFHSWEPDGSASAIINKLNYRQIQSKIFANLRRGMDKEKCDKDFLQIVSERAEYWERRFGVAHKRPILLPQ